MSRQKRREFQGAIHLVTLRGYSAGNVFYDPEIFKKFPGSPRAHAPYVQIFEGLLWDTCEQYDGRVHAYVVEPNSTLIVVQTLGAPLAWIVHDLLARYSRHLFAASLLPAGERPFPRRYKAQIVQPAKLPYVVRYVHHREVPGDTARRAVNHPFSSSLIYCARRPQPEYFVVDTTRKVLKSLGYVGPNAYFEFIAARDSPSIAELLSRRVIGDRSFADDLGARCSGKPRVPSAHEILREVTGTLLHSEPGIACSSTHRGALARALVAWYAMRTGAAQISTVAGWFGVTSSNLRYLIRQHRKKNPQYFSRSRLDLFPMHSVPGVPTDPPNLDQPWASENRPLSTHAHPVL
jgi:hypothetical protein